MQLARPSLLMTSVCKCSWSILRNWPCPTLLKHFPRISLKSFPWNFPRRIPHWEIARRLSGQIPWRISGEYFLGCSLIKHSYLGSHLFVCVCLLLSYRADVHRWYKKNVLFWIKKFLLSQTSCSETESENVALVLMLLYVLALTNSINYFNLSWRSVSDFVLFASWQFQIFYRIEITWNWRWLFFNMFYNFGFKGP